MDFFDGKDLIKIYLIKLFALFSMKENVIDILNHFHISIFDSSMEMKSHTGSPRYHPAVFVDFLNLIWNAYISVENINCYTDIIDRNDLLVKFYLT